MYNAAAGTDDNSVAQRHISQATPDTDRIHLNDIALFSITQEVY